MSRSTDCPGVSCCGPLPRIRGTCFRWSSWGTCPAGTTCHWRRWQQVDAQSRRAGRRSWTCWSEACMERPHRLTQRPASGVLGLAAMPSPRAPSHPHVPLHHTFISLPQLRPPTSCPGGLPGSPLAEHLHRHRPEAAPGTLMDPPWACVPSALPLCCDRVS